MQYYTDGRDKILIFLDGDHLTHRMHCNEKRIGTNIYSKKITFVSPVVSPNYLAWKYPENT